ncbi:M28 family peptidase [Candidatus Palauibacter sp.]|uniref:M28 family peptidase n=1 Tax=Candidatus Palauibacter sp. TaxID=3101350 RepID=UPI003B51AB61
MKRKLPGIRPTLPGARPAAMRVPVRVRLWVPLLALAASPAGISAQAGTGAGAATITADDLRFRIGALAHDSMRGRATPSPELDKAARHIARRFEEFGLQPADGDSYLQEYPLTASRAGSPGRQSLEIVGPGGGTIDAADYLPVPGGRGQAAGPLAVVTPGGADPPTGAVAIMRVSSDDMRWGLESVRGILDGGAVAVLLALDVADDYFDGIRRFYARERLSVGMPEELGAPVALVRTHALPEALRAALASGAGTNVWEATVRTHSEFREERAYNTIGWIEGSDPDLRGEFVVFTAHMDHVGVGRPVDGDSIYNGADDDASGTAAIIELAQAFASLETPPRRSLVFMTVSGEERGLLGSAWYAENPLFPLGATVANLNIDMIGRNWRDTVVAIGADESTLGATLRQTLRGHPELGLETIDDPWPEENFYFRSDHYNFARKGVPILFFFTGTHEDYHGPNDEPDRILYDKTARIARLIFHLGQSIADAEERPEWDPAAYRRVVEGGGGS